MRIGIDMGGTKIEAIALDRAGRERARMRRPTPREDYHGTLAAIAGLVHDLEARAGQRGTVGVGLPGAVSPLSGLAKNANATWINGRPFREDLAALLGRPVRVANDGNCFAVSEAIDGAAAGARVVLGLTLGTGVGGGIAIEGRVHDGPNAIGGEVGHVPLPWPTPDEVPGPGCFCGRLGCLEAWLSGHGLMRAYAQAGGAQDVAPIEVVRRAEAGEPSALAALARYRERLARAVAMLADVLDPDVIVVGGGLSTVPALLEGLDERVAPWVFGGEFATPIRRARHGDASGARGAAWLWPEGSVVDGAASD